jgi:integrase/recombinase XerD
LRNGRLSPKPFRRLIKNFENSVSHPVTRNFDLYDDAGISDATSHSGRRTFITNLAAKGIGVRVLAELSAHSSIATTQRYIDVNDEQLRAAVELA